MTSLNKNRAAEFRARAEDARLKAFTATDEALCKELLADADLWERMATFEERSADHRAIDGALHDGSPQKEATQIRKHTGD